MYIQSAKIRPISMIVQYNGMLPHIRKKRGPHEDFPLYGTLQVPVHVFLCTRLSFPSSESGPEFNARHNMTQIASLCPTLTLFLNR